MTHYEIRQSITDRTDESIKIFLKEITRFKLLSPEEERDLAIKASNGDIQSRNKLIESNLRFVVSLAKQYQNKGVELADLISAGTQGLIAAVDKFDPTRDNRFLTYAGWDIRDALINEVIYHGKTVRVPFNKTIAINKINAAINQFEVKNERPPTADEIAEMFELSEEEAKTLMNASNLTVTKEFEDYDASYEPTVNINTDYLRNFLKANLNPVEYQVTLMSFGLDGEEMELKEIAEDLNLTTERVRQMKNTAIIKLRKHPSITNLLKMY
jgi:RNA polymerase primary sigma factor